MSMHKRSPIKLHYLNISEVLFCSSHLVFTGTLQEPATISSVVQTLHPGLDRDPACVPVSRRIWCFAGIPAPAGFCDFAGIFNRDSIIKKIKISTKIT